MTASTFPDEAAIFERFAADAELSNLSRFLDGTIKFRVGADCLLLHFDDGSLSRATTHDSGFDSSNVLVDVPVETWQRVMEEQPKPFYQDFWAAKFHHGVQIEGDLDLMSAYYGVIRRAGQLLRALANGSTK